MLKCAYPGIKLHKEECMAIMVYNGNLPPAKGGEEMHTACLR